MGQQLGTFVALAEDWGLTSTTNMVVHKYLEL